MSSTRWCDAKGTRRQFQKNDDPCKQDETKPDDWQRETELMRETTEEGEEEMETVSRGGGDGDEDEKEEEEVGEEER